MRRQQGSPLGLLVFPAVILGLICANEPRLGLALIAFYAFLVWGVFRLEVLRARQP